MFDYLKAVELINKNPQDSSAGMYIYDETRSIVPEQLYKYYSVNDNLKLNKIKFETLFGKKIYLAEPKFMNDPFDGKAYFYNEERLLDFERLKKSKGRLIDDFSAYFKLTCFSNKGISNMPMWAHYANNHTGFCVSYCTSDQANVRLKSSLFPVQYTDKRIDITDMMYRYTEMLIEQIEDNISKGLQGKIDIADTSIFWTSFYLNCIKHSSWSYEEEFRFVTSSNDSYIDAMPSEIYVGNKCNYENTQILIQIAKSLNLPIYRMVFDEKSLKYEMTYETIEI